MTPEELKEMLGIKPKAAKPTIGMDFDFKGVEERVAATMERDLRPTCFNTDEWELSHGQRLLTKINRNDIGLRDTDVADFFAAAYRQYPERENDHVNPRFQEFVDNLLESPDFQVLHESTRSNVTASDMAAVEFANQWSKLVEQDEERQEQLSNSKPSKNQQAAEDADHIACLNAVNKAVKAANDEVEQMEAMGKAIGVSGSQHGQMPTERVQQLFNQVKNNHRLRRICELAGRYRMAAQAKQRQKVVHGYDDMIGVELSGDISRLLPIELAQLADEDFELDAMRRLVEKQSMSRQYRGVEKIAKGPIVICVDESGSMDGEPLFQAKAFALAMFWIAKHQRRDCWLVSFSDGEVMFDSKQFFSKPDANSLLNWLGHNYSGGTAMNTPLARVPREWGTFKDKADMIIITDDEVDVPESLKQSFLKFKAEHKVKLTTIAIGAQATNMKAVSDETFHVSGIAVDSEAVSKCMSI